MIRTTLPIQIKTLDNGLLNVKQEDILVAIDTSIFAEQRWEANFPTNATKETLFSYIERLVKNQAIDTAYILSMLKAVYCFLEGEAIRDFKAFCQMFDFTDEKYLEELVSKIKDIFNLVLSRSTVKPKNY